MTIVVVFLANAALLILQLTAGRLLAPFIGSSLATWTSVIGMFLAGISVGNYVGGWLADRSASGRTLALVLVGGGLAILSAVGIPRGLGDGSAVSGLALHPRIALLSFLVCFPSAFVLSLTTPVAIKLLLPDVRKTGRVVGMVYAVGTLGSLVGNFATGFGLMAAFGISVILYGTAGMLFLLAACALPMSRAAAVDDPAHEATMLPIDPANVLSLPAACATVFICSFCSMGLELAASRILAPSVGVSIYTWTGIIGVVLAGVVAGNYLGGWIADRSPKRETLGSSLFWCGLLALFVIVLFSLGIKHQLKIDNWIKSWLVEGPVPADGKITGDHPALDWLLPLQVVVYSAALFFLPMLAFGTISPQATRLAVRDWAHAGRVAGHVYAWSCAGAIAGTFAAGWSLIGTFGSLYLVLGVCAVLMILSLPVGNMWRKPVELIGTGLVLGIVLSLTTFGNSYLSLVPEATNKKAGIASTSASTCAYQKETNYYLIRVEVRNEDDTYRAFRLDQLDHSYVVGRMAENEDGTRSWQAYVEIMGYGHEQVQSEFCRAAYEAHRGDTRVLVIGGGGYTLPRWVDAVLPTVRMEVVEIDPGVTEAVHAALGMPRNTKIESYHLDGRQFVQQAQPGSYHLVIQDAVNDLSVPWHIMTREYNELVKRSMASDGTYLLTVIDEFPNGQLLPAAIHTMKQSFAHVDLLADYPHWDSEGFRAVYVIAGSNQPLDLDKLKTTLADQIDPAKSRADLQKLRQAIAEQSEQNIRDGKQPSNVMTTMAMKPEELEKYLAEAKPVLLTDDFAPVDNLMAKTFRRR